jgi:selenocysteine-specific elongation factor
MRRLILGTAGHIDHGKTALVKALTGVDTDRLKEEKERGITVDLGFAELIPREGVRFGVVDVPGHEGFIRNMLAGATGIDVALLVVAADEGVMPQTREHLSIMRLLAVPQLVVAVSKADLVEGEWLDLVMEEIRDLLDDSPYASASLVPVSSVTGQGLEKLSDLLGALGLEAGDRGAGDVARLPLDRVFTVRGAGTVVTGTLWTGALRVAGRVHILPGDREARIRSLQVHGHSVEEAKAGERVAVGLTGSRISHLDLSRGQTLVEEEGWTTSHMLTCRLSVLPGTGWEIEQGQRVRVHLGTAEIMARVALLEADRLDGGEEGWAQLRLEQPLLGQGPRPFRSSFLFSGHHARGRAGSRDGL